MSRRNTQLTNATTAQVQYQETNGVVTIAEVQTPSKTLRLRNDQ
jgi:hypothetical protein